MVSAFNGEEYRYSGTQVQQDSRHRRTGGATYLGPRAHKWFQTMLSKCITENNIPKLWGQSKTIVILKPGKYSAIPKSYRPISLLCHTYKLYERMILNRVTPLLEQHLIKEQAGIRPGKSCTNQLLNLTQHIEDDYRCSIRRSFCSKRYGQP